MPRWARQETPLLEVPIRGDLMTALDGALLLGDERHLGREAEHMLVFAMSTEHVLERLRDGQLCIAAGDRPEALLTHRSEEPRIGTECGSTCRSGWREAH